MSNTSKEELFVKIQKQELLRKIQAGEKVAVASFRLKSTKDDCIEAIALPYVLIKSKDDRMETVQNRSSIISELVEEKLVEVNFELEVNPAEYEVVYQSKFYHTFCDMVAEGGQKPNFIFDTPNVLEGVITAYTGCGCGHHHDEEHKCCGGHHHNDEHTHGGCGCGHHDDKHESCNCK
ncbi:MAG: hypothetical protein RR444_02085 [Oscillospiraceae bacterium]